MTIHINAQTYTWQESLHIAETIAYDVTNPWLHSFYQFILQWNHPSEYIQVQSSGSTGTPKIIALSKQQMMASAQRTIKAFEVPPQATLLLCMDCKYIGAMMMVVRAIQNDAHLVITAPQQFPSEAIRLYQYDFAAMVPLQLKYLIEQKFPVDQYFKKIIIGGGSISPTLQQKINGHIHQTQIFETFGMTETISHIAYKIYSDEYFQLLPGVEIKTNENLCMMLRDSLTHQSWIQTNDIIEQTDTHHFKFVGRYDFIINSGGIKISPEKIEQMLSTYIPHPILCIGIPDETLGEQLILLIQGDPIPIDVSIFEALPKYERPKNLFFMSEFVYLSNQKIDRLSTKKLFLQGQRI